MARVNIAIPDELLAQAKAAGLNVPRVSALAVSAELDRRAKIAALEDVLRELEAAPGPVPAEEAQEAREWPTASRASCSASLPRRGLSRGDPGPRLRRLERLVGSVADCRNCCAVGCGPRRCPASSWRRP